MLYADRFSGHMDPADHRTPLHGAAGCVWPTVPPQRYYLTSGNATGVFVPFNLSGMLVARMVGSVDHNLYNYAQLGPFPGISLVRCEKHAQPDGIGYRWLVEIDAGSGCGIVSWDLDFPEQTCNRDVPLGNRSCPILPVGSTGSQMRMIQVEFDKSSPPS